VIRGRVPRFAQIRLIVPCWPTLASSWNQISIGHPARSGGIAARASSAKFFKSLLRLRIALRVLRTPGDASEIKIFQEFADTPLMQVNPKAILDTIAQIGATPTHHTIFLKVRTGRDPRS